MTKSDSTFDGIAEQWDENPGHQALAQAVVEQILGQVPVRADMDAFGTVRDILVAPSACRC